MARPVKQIDKKSFEQLCMLQCTQQEICDFFDGIDHKTLGAWIKRTYGRGASYSQIYEQKRGKGRVSLRRMQWNLAEKNAAMAIFLGKNLLGQSDFPENATSDEAVAKANAQIHALADLINNPVDDIDIEDLGDDEPLNGGDDE